VAPRALAILWLFPALLLAANAARPQAPAAVSQKPSVKPADLALRIHAKINEERAKHGLSALAWDKALARIAAGHSRDMAKRKYLAHDSPEGQGFPQRYRRAGYTCRIRIGRTIYGGAENIALNHLYNSVEVVNGAAHYDWNSSEQIAGRALAGWMKSPAHRENILTPQWKREGIGVEISPDDMVYVRRIFAEWKRARTLSLREAGMPTRLSLASLDESSRRPEPIAIFLARNHIVDRPFCARGARVALRRRPHGRIGSVFSRRSWRFRLRRWRVFIEHKGIGC
jgi:uncharacterized protein YkwD